MPIHSPLASDIQANLLRGAIDSQGLLLLHHPYTALLDLVFHAHIHLDVGVVRC